MSKQRVAAVRLFLLMIVAILLAAIGGGVFAQGVGDGNGVPENAIVPPPFVDGSQITQDNGKPPLIGGIPSESPPAAAPRSSAEDGTSVDFQSSPNAPVITIWQGSAQKAGVKGDPQKWVNITGSVSPRPTTLTYSLNGGPSVILRTGPDTRRLARAGDFNIDLDYTALNPGSNSVTITATDSQGGTTVATVTVNYGVVGQAWVTPQTYTYDWATVTGVDDLAQVVDGKWSIAGGAVKPDTLGYDRLLGFGDMSWRDYTVTVPITFTGIDPAGYEWPSNGPGIGILVRWAGHYDSGRTSPLEGWTRLGALAWYHWGRAGTSPSYTYSEALQMYRYGGSPGQIVTKSRKLELNTPYIFKVRIQSNPSKYQFKVWEASATEPTAWDIDAPGIVGEPASGGFMLVAHHVDARFGKITVDLESTSPPPTLTVKKAGSGSGSVGLLPSSNGNTYRFGQIVRLTATPEAGSHFTGWRGGLSGSDNPARLEMFADQTVTAVFASDTAGPPVSDDFSACELDPRWEYIDPLGHSGLAMPGSQLQISVPAGTVHDLWTDNHNAPRVMQAIADTDFGIDVKFNSSMNAKYQMQGVLVEADDTNFLRYSFYHDGAGYRIAAHTILNNVPATRFDQPIGISAPPMYLRVVRTDDTWKLYYSGNGQNWTQATSFDFGLDVASLGVFAGNAGSNPPAMVSKVDYFFNTASPIVPQDNVRILTVTSAGPGSGTVTRSPNKTNYACNEQVTLTAYPDADSQFDSWGGSLTGSANPATITMADSMAIVANFKQKVVYHTLTVSTDGGGTVEANPLSSQFVHGTQVTLTAKPQNGFVFSGWSGDATGTINPLTITMDSDKTIVAKFVAGSYTLAVQVPEGGGSVTMDPPGPKFAYGTEVRLTAYPLSGYVFSGWSGDATGTINPLTITMDSDKTIVARFVAGSYTLVVHVPEGGGWVTMDPPGPKFAYGTEVRLTAHPLSGYGFSEWGGDITGNTNPYVLTIKSDMTVDAIFRTYFLFLPVIVNMNE